MLYNTNKISFKSSKPSFAMASNGVLYQLKQVMYNRRVAVRAYISVTYELFRVFDAQAYFTAQYAWCNAV